MVGTIICVAVVFAIIALSRSGIAARVPRRRPRPPVPGLRNTDFFRPDPSRDGFDPGAGDHHHGHHDGGGHGGGHH